MVRAYTGETPETLLDGLSELPENAYIAVGSDTAYMFIGTASDFFTELKTLERYYSTKDARGDKPRNMKFVPLIDRKVIDIFVRYETNEPDITTFIVEGGETGRIWLLSENKASLSYIHDFIEREDKWNERRNTNKRKT